MSEHFDAAAAVGAGLADRQHAWTFIAGLAAAFTAAPLGPEDGVPDDELRRAERALGTSLPVALREAYGLFGRRRDLTANQDPLMPPARLGLRDGVLFFRRENQDCAFWGIAEPDLALPDAPVVLAVGDDSIPFTDTVSLAMAELVLSEVLFGDDALYDACELPAELLPVLRENFPRIRLPDYPMWAGADALPSAGTPHRTPSCAWTATRTGPGCTPVPVPTPASTRSAGSCRGAGSAEPDIHRPPVGAC